MKPSLRILLAPACTMALLFLAHTPTPAFAQSCTPDEAEARVIELYQDVSGESSAPLRKEKHGHVLVARSSALNAALANPAARAELSAELNRTAGMLGSRPAAVCAEVDRLRAKYGL